MKSAVFFASFFISVVVADIATNSIGRNPANIIDSLRKQIEFKEKELLRAERTNKNFEKMLELMNIMGQVDTFLTDRTRALVKKLAVLTEDSDNIVVAKTVQKS